MRFAYRYVSHFNFESLLFVQVVSLFVVILFLFLFLKVDCLVD